MDVLEHEKSACSTRHLQYLATYSVDVSSLKASYSYYSVYLEWPLVG